MPRVELSGGSYQARSLIAGAQRCVNLYPEKNPDDSTFKTTYYPTPGLKKIGQSPNAAAVRGLYRSTSNSLYAAVGNQLYYVDQSWKFKLLGTISNSNNPVSMADNGLTLVLVDGTTSGYTVNLQTNAFAAINDPAFYGATRVDYIDTYFLFNKPGTPQWYASDSLSVTFDPLWFANKQGYPDNVSTIACVHREIWIIGERTTEIWSDAGNPDFPFSIVPGAFIDHGTESPFSLQRSDNNLFWLSSDSSGTNIVLQGQGYTAKRISTYAMEYDFAKYSTTKDAVGWMYQQEGHVFYVLCFPNAGKSWCYDLATSVWHERIWLDDQGNEHRHRGNCHAFAYGINVIGDFETGAIYKLDQNIYNDDGRPIRRIRSFPNMINDNRRVIYNSFIADFEVGTTQETFPVIFPEDDVREIADENFNVISDDAGNTQVDSEDFIQNFISTDDGSVLSDERGNPIVTKILDDGLLNYIADESGNRIVDENQNFIVTEGALTRSPGPLVSLRWSDTKGKTWGNPVTQDLGYSGEYDESVNWSVLGSSRNRVFELSWAGDFKTALNGAFIIVKQARF